MKTTEDVRECTAERGVEIAGWRDKPEIRDWRQRWQNTTKKAFTGLCSSNQVRQNDRFELQATKQKFKLLSRVRVATIDDENLLRRQQG